LKFLLLLDTTVKVLLDGNEDETGDIYKDFSISCAMNFAGFVQSAMFYIYRWILSVIHHIKGTVFTSNSKGGA